ALSAALHKMRVETFGDLGGLDLRQFERASKIGAKLFLEVGQLIHRARQKEGGDDFDQPSLAPRPKWQVGVKPHAPRRLAAIAATLPKAQKAAQSDLLSAELAETIFIPQEARGTPLSSFRLSVRLQHIFAAKGFCLIGDLNGLA